jgi:hypothetical protein
MKTKGSVAIYFVLIIIVGVLLIVSVLSYLMIGEMKMSRDIGLSGSAYQAADSGMEFILAAKKTYTTRTAFAEYYYTIDPANFDKGESGTPPKPNWICSGSHTYWWAVGNCSYCLEFDEVISTITSIGRCGEIRRAVQTTYQ